MGKCDMCEGELEDGNTVESWRVHPKCGSIMEKLIEEKKDEI